MEKQTRARLKMLGIFLMFLGPLALAYALYYGFAFGSAGTNEGELVSPAEPLPALTLESPHNGPQPSARVLEQAWTILQVAPDGCDDACRQSLDETRQIRALLHRRAARVQRVLLVDDAADRPSFDAQPDLSVYRSDTRAWTRMFEKQGANTPGTVYLIDPLGNWMLYYPPSGDGEALFKDVKHLLKLSHIG